MPERRRKFWRRRTEMVRRRHSGDRCAQIDGGDRVFANDGQNGNRPLERETPRMTSCAWSTRRPSASAACCVDLCFKNAKVN